MADRPIDRHEIRRKTKSNVIDTRTQINKWRDSWLACYELVRDYPDVDIKSFHELFQQWVPMINYIFDNQIGDLTRYEAIFFYCQESPGPKEIIQLYFGENRLNNMVRVYILFNQVEFIKIYEKYCKNMTQSNRMLVDESRGTINISSFENHEVGLDPASYFKNMTCWQMLFIFTMHALAHWDAYDKYEHSYYDSHLRVRDSPFYKMHFYGKVVNRRFDQF